MINSLSPASNLRAGDMKPKYEVIETLPPFGLDNSH
jgi:hypothetical protein